MELPVKIFREVTAANVNQDLPTRTVKQAIAFLLYKTNNGEVTGCPRDILPKNSRQSHFLVWTEFKKASKNPASSSQRYSNI